MLLSSAPHSAERFSAPAPGLRSLLVAVPDGGARRGVVTRAAVAPRGDAARCRAGDRDVEESRGRGTSIGHKEDIKKAEEDVRADEKEEEDEGCWVSYGRRCPRRRLPPPIPSLIGRGALRRTRTDDGRLVMRTAPVVLPECVRARRCGGRLTMQLVEREDEPAALTAPSLPAPISTRQDGTAAHVGDDTAAAPTIGEGVADDTAATAPLGGEGVDDAHQQAVAAPEKSPAVPPPRVPSVGCFEDVFKYDSIGSSSLHQMPSLRVVH